MRKIARRRAVLLGPAIVAGMVLSGASAVSATAAPLPGSAAPAAVLADGPPTTVPGGGGGSGSKKKCIKIFGKKICW